MFKKPKTSEHQQKHFHAEFSQFCDGSDSLYLSEAPVTELCTEHIALVCRSLFVAFMSFFEIQM